MSGPLVWSERNKTVLVDEDRGYHRELDKKQLADLIRSASDRLAFLITCEALKGLLPPNGE